MDLLGHLLRHTPHFRGRGRLVHHWLNRPRRNDVRHRSLPGGLALPCDLTIPYEAMIWLQSEEEQEVRILRKLLRPGDNFIDAGANVGLWTLTAASVVHRKSGRVWAFEPNPTTYVKLCANVKTNSLSKVVQTMNAACGARNEQVPFRCQHAHNISQIAKRIDGHTIPVLVRTIDSLAVGQKIDGIKLDVQGHEEQALRGAQAILQRSRPWLCVEFNTALAGSPRLGDWPVHQLLLRLGYRCWRFTDALRHRRHLPLSPESTVSGYCNLFYSVR